MSENQLSTTTSLKMFGSFALTYYAFLAVFSGFVLVYNRFLIPSDFIIGKNQYLSQAQTFVIVGGALLINIGVLVGLVMLFFRRRGALGIFGFSALFLLLHQTIFNGFSGWQKIVIESTLLIIILLINPHKKPITDKNDAEIQD